MIQWEQWEDRGWLDRAADVWSAAGANAIRARGRFDVFLDASPEVLAVLRHIVQRDWAWSATRLIPARENWTPPGSSRYNGRAIHEALYPHRVSILNWRTKHVDPARAALLFERELKRDGDRLRPDLSLLAFSGAASLAVLRGSPAPFALTAVYQVGETQVHALGVAPRVLKGSRNLLALASGRIAPSFEEAGSPLEGLSEAIESSVFLHSRQQSPEN